MHTVIPLTNTEMALKFRKYNLALHNTGVPENQANMDALHQPRSIVECKLEFCGCSVILWMNILNSYIFSSAVTQLSWAVLWPERSQVINKGNLSHLFHPPDMMRAQNQSLCRRRAEELTLHGRGAQLGDAWGSSGGHSELHRAQMITEGWSVWFGFGLWNNVEICHPSFHP